MAETIGGRFQQAGRKAGIRKWLLGGGGGFEGTPEASSFSFEGMIDYIDAFAELAVEELVARLNEGSVALRGARGGGEWTALRELSEKATPGPWTLEILDEYATGHITSPMHTYCGNSAGRKDSITAPDSMTYDDGEFIIACVNYVREALAAAAPAPAAQISSVGNSIFASVPTCALHHETMVLSFYDRPDSPPGNGYVCESCVNMRKTAVPPAAWYTREQLLELVRDFLNNYACSCMAIASPCPRCKVTIDEGRAVVTGVSFDPEMAAHPPQDGQGAELLGPPRGGSSSDLAEQATELRKLPEMWLEVRRKIMDGKGAAKPDAKDLSYADAMKHCAIELSQELRKYDF